MKIRKIEIFKNLKAGGPKLQVQTEWAGWCIAGATLLLEGAPPYYCDRGVIRQTVELFECQQCVVVAK